MWDEEIPNLLKQNPVDDDATYPPFLGVDDFVRWANVYFPLRARYRKTQVGAYIRAQLVWMLWALKHGEKEYLRWLK